MDRDSEMSTGSVVAGSSGSDLGRQSGDSGPSNKWNDQPTVSTMAVSPPKTARAPANGSHRVSCLVDGCTADLSKGREYHRRHKVCELHFKTPVLMVHRQQQRFCQQCSRFQLVEEFDEVKRSCSRRLAGHNKRRRKPQPCSMNPGILFPDHQGLLFVETTFGVRNLSLAHNMHETFHLLRDCHRQQRPPRFVQTSNTSPSHTVPPADGIPAAAQPFVSALQYGGLSHRHQATQHQLLFQVQGRRPAICGLFWFLVVLMILRLIPRTYSMLQVKVSRRRPAEIFPFLGLFMVLMIGYC